MKKFGRKFVIAYLIVDNACAAAMFIVWWYWPL